MRREKYDRIASQMVDAAQALYDRGGGKDVKLRFVIHTNDWYFLKDYARWDAPRHPNLPLYHNGKAGKVVTDFGDYQLTYSDTVPEGHVNIIHEEVPPCPTCGRPR